MCRDNDHGGRRCPENDSTGRRLRRKQAAAKETYPPTPPQADNQNPVVASGDTPTFVEAKAAVDAFKARVQEDRPEDVTPAEWDAQLEKELVEVGYKLDAYIEEEVGDGIDYGPDHFNEYWDAKYEEMIAAVPDEKKRRYLEIQEVVDARRERLNRGEEDLDDYNDAYDTLIEELGTLDLSWRTDALEAVDKRTDEYRLQVERDRVTAYAEASKRLIASIRPVGGTLGGLETSEPGIREAFEETVAKDYPTEWIEASNQAGSLTFKPTDGYDIGGAHTTLRTGEDTGVEYSSNLRLEFFANEFSREQWDKHWGEISKIPGISRNKVLIRGWTDAETYILTGPEEELFDPKVHGAPMAGKPTGKGWEKRSTIYGFQQAKMVREGATDEEKAEYVRKVMEPRWVRPVTSTKAEETVITVPDLKKHAPVMRNAILGVAYHEFGHRVEDTYKDGLLPRMEKAFLERRSPEAEHILSPMQVGLLRQGGFVDQYMGRVYPGRENYEIFTTGVQAVFGKSYGGLRGLSKDFRRSDAEHRAFTLGCLAAL